MTLILGSIFLSREDERLLTKSEFVKVMRITGKTMYELENYYFEDCCWMIPIEDNADTVLINQEYSFVYIFAN